MYIYTLTYTYVYMLIYLYINIHKCTHIHILLYVYIYINIYVSLYICIYVYNISIYIYIHIHIWYEEMQGDSIQWMHRYVCTHTHIQINTMWGPGHGFELNRRWRIFVFVFLSSFGWQKISRRAGGKVILRLPCQAKDGLLHNRCMGGVQSPLKHSVYAFVREA